MLSNVAVNRFRSLIGVLFPLVRANSSGGLDRTDEQTGKFRSLAGYAVLRARRLLRFLRRLVLRRPNFLGLFHRVLDVWITGLVTALGVSGKQCGHAKPCDDEQRA